MLKRAAVLGLLLSAAGAIVAPTAAFAQNGYVYGGYSYGDNRPYYQQDGRYCDRHERHEWREHERAERRWRDNEAREHEWREHERREDRRDYRDGFRSGYDGYNGR